MDTEQEQTQETKNRGGRPRLQPPPTTAEQVRALMAIELTKASPDRFRTQGLSRLLDSFEEQEAKAAANTASTNAAIEAANTRIAELQPLADRVPGLEEELTALKADWDVRLSTMRAELTAQSKHQLALAEKAEREASHKLRLAEENYSQGAMLETFALIRGLTEQANIPMPSFWDASPNLAPIFWTLWGWSVTKARVYVSYRKSYPSCTEEFKRHALMLLLMTVPHYEDGGPQREPIDKFFERSECVREMAMRFSVLDELNRAVEQERVHRASQHHQRHQWAMSIQSAQQAQLGLGRVPINVQPEPSESNVPVSEHVLGCCCTACGGSGLPEHLREDLTLGTITPRMEHDMNEPRPMTGGEEEL